MFQISEMADILWCNSLATRKVSRRITQLYDTTIASSGLRSTQVHILGQLFYRRHNPPTLTELADDLVLERSALGHNLKPLERDGLVVLVENEHDRRERHVVLTSAGLTKLQDVLPLWANAHEKLSAIYGEKEMQDLRNKLNAIAHDDRLM